jgi:hypothetical protein
MVSKISITAQLIPKFNFAHETSGSTVCPDIPEIDFFLYH